MTKRRPEMAGRKKAMHYRGQDKEGGDGSGKGKGEI